MEGLDGDVGAVVECPSQFGPKTQTCDAICSESPISVAGGTKNAHLQRFGFPPATYSIGQHLRESCRHLQSGRQNVTDDDLKRNSGQSTLKIVVGSWRTANNDESNEESSAESARGRCDGRRNLVFRAEARKINFFCRWPIRVQAVLRTKAGFRPNPA